MAKNLVYKKQESVILKVIGLLDIDRMTIDVEGEEKSIKTLAQDFDGTEVELTLKIKNDVELDEPENRSDDE
jgi:hypothetical protein